MEAPEYYLSFIDPIESRGIFNKEIKTLKASNKMKNDMNWNFSMFTKYLTT